MKVLFFKSVKKKVEICNIILDRMENRPFTDIQVCCFILQGMQTVSNM